MPFDAIAAEHLYELISRGVREDRTLGVKQDLPFGDSGELDILGDVAAMANAAGGTLIYGASSF